MDEREDGIEVPRRLTDWGGVRARVRVGVVRTPSRALLRWFSVELALLPLFTLFTLLGLSFLI